MKAGAVAAGTAIFFRSLLPAAEIPVPEKHLEPKAKFAVFVTSEGQRVAFREYRGQLGVGSRVDSTFVAAEYDSASRNFELTFMRPGGRALHLHGLEGRAYFSNEARESREIDSLYWLGIITLASRSTAALDSGFVWFDSIGQGKVKAVFFALKEEARKCERVRRKNNGGEGEPGKKEKKEKQDHYRRPYSDYCRNDAVKRTLAAIAKNRAQTPLARSIPRVVP